MFPTSEPTSEIVPAFASRPRFAIFASGRGSNAAALFSAFESGLITGEVVTLIGDQPGAGVLSLAQERGYAGRCIPREHGQSRQDHERALIDSLFGEPVGGVDYILLAGYMRILTEYFLTEFSRRGGVEIFNIHPALLPDFPGLRAIERQVEAGARIIGATVHLVRPEVDAGPVILLG